MRSPTTAKYRMPVLILWIAVLASSSDAAWVDRTDNGGTVTASSQIHEGESKEMAFDNTTSTKWLTNYTPTGWIQFQFPDGEQYEIARYSIASANDAPDRDPDSWILYGSNDGANWDAVDTRGDQSWPDRYYRREFICADPNAYSYYRLDITSNNGSSNLTGFSEMELLEETFIAENPSPADEAEGVTDTDLLLSWEGPSEISNPEYRIYLDDSFSLVQNADPSVLKSQQPGESYLVDTLDLFTSYYWRVDVVDGATVYEGDIWQFQTQMPDVPCLTLLADIDYDCVVSFPDLVILASQWLSESCPTSLCADLDDSSRVDLVDLAAVSQDWFLTAEKIVLHEIMADNETTLTDNFGDYSDWIEIKNLGETPQNLQGWFLTDDEGLLNKWTFPDITIAAKGYLLVYASGRDISVFGQPLHTNFQLDNDGEYLALVKPDLTIAHEFSPAYPSLGYDETYGLTSLPGEYAFVTSLLAEPTPGQINAAAVLSAVPEYSEPGGIFTSPLTVELSISDPDSEIRYTLDGSVPVLTSALYTAPLAISETTCLRAAAFRDKYLPGKTDTRSYIFLDDVAQQPILPDGFPSTWKDTAADYEMDPDIVNHATYGPQLQASLLSLPSISIVTELDNLFDSSSGIYANPLQEGVVWERPASVEIFMPSGTEEFRIDCGLRIQGGAFRRFDLTRKKSFRLLFKRDYGATKLEFPLFDYDDNAVDHFDTITLRAGANDGYSWNAAYLTEQYTRDEFGRSLQRDSGNAGSHGTFMHLYLNGLYWGLYNAVERPDNSFSAFYYGGDKDDWDAINSGDVTEGDLLAWNMLLDKCRAGLTTNSAYQEIQGNNPDGSPNPAYPNLIDIPNYIDYLTINMWGGNNDWPWRNYWICRLRTEESTGFKFYCWDYESTMGSPASVENKVSANYDSGVGVPHHWLKENAEYRMLFADRLHRLFFNDGILTADAVVQRYSEVADWVELSIIAESARWGDMHYHPPLGLDEWTARRDWILNTYIPPRSDVVLGQMRTAGFYPQVDAPVFNINGSYQHGGHINTGDMLSMNSGAGSIWYTLDGGDPRLVGGAVDPNAIEYTGPFLLNESKLVKARALESSEWSALNEATFAVSVIAESLRITEIMYHPADPNTEFIELQNIGSEAINLNLVAFTEGVDFIFGSVSLDPNQYILVVENQSEFEGKYGTGHNIAGEYTGALDNGGEGIRLADALDRPIHDFSYNDSWYDITDGDGFSLVIKDSAATDPNLWDNKAGWRPSAVVGGSPGAEDISALPPIGSVVINEVLAHSDAELYDWIELYNTTDEAINIGGWFLSDNNDDDPNRMKYEITEGASIGAYDYIVFSEDQDFGNPADAGCNKPFQLSENGETVYLQSGSGGVLTGYSEEEDFGASEQDVAFGRYQKSTGAFNFVAMSANTRGAVNAYPKVGPIIISEIMYHPPTNGDAEYVELQNIGGSPVTLYDASTGVAWRFVDDKDDIGIEYHFPTAAPATVAAGEKVLLVKNKAAFESEFLGGSDISTLTVQWFEWTDGSLSNGGEKPEIQLPGDVDEFLTRYYIRVDRVSYDDTVPWPTEPDGAGQSLIRISNTAYGNDVVNWQAATPSPGS